MNPAESGEKHLQEITMQTVAQNLTSEPNLQTAQNIIPSNIHNVPTMIGSSTQIIGKSVSLDLSPKLSIRKPVIPATITTAVEPSKMSTTICPVGSTVRIISPSMLHTVERQAGRQPTQQIVTNIAPTYHVPRGPAAVANISAPRAAIATPIVRSSTSHSVHVSRPGANPTVLTQQWPAKATTNYPAQSQRYPIPSVSRVAARAPATVYSGGQQSRLTTPTTPGRPVQTAVVTGIPGAPSRLIAPVLQTNGNVARVSITQGKPAAAQSTVAQATTQPRLQNVQSNINKPPNNLQFANRVAVCAPVISSANKIVTVTSIQTAATRQLAINTVPGTSATNLSRIVIPHCQAPTQSATARVVQAVTSLSNFAPVSRAVATTASVGSVTRVVPPGPTTGVTRITSMPLHPLPIPAVTRTLATPIKIAQTQNVGHTMQIKPAVQQVVPKTTVASVVTSTTPSQSIPGQYMPPTTTTYYSLDPSGNYSQFRQTTVQPVRLTIVDTGYEESHGKSNSSPRPSILRKREHDGSPAKASVAKNLVPVLACMSANTTPLHNSPPASPSGDGCQSSGSTTVSATSSPGLDEPEQSRIPMNTNVEMSPRKKPRKQQLTSVELTESRCTDEEMQFIVEEKIKKEAVIDTRDIKTEKKFCPDDVPTSGVTTQIQTTPVRTRPTLSMLGSWKHAYNGRQHHYRRPSEVRPREERRLTVAELAQQKFVLQKLNGWKIHHLTTQMDDLAELEKQVHEKLKTTLNVLETPQNVKNLDDSLERVKELIKGNMQRSSLISESMFEAHKQLIAIFQHKDHVSNILQRCGNKRSQKKRDK